MVVSGSHLAVTTKPVKFLAVDDVDDPTDSHKQIPNEKVISPVRICWGFWPFYDYYVLPMNREERHANKGLRVLIGPRHTEPNSLKSC
jgi:hypothetical protein